MATRINNNNNRLFYAVSAVGIAPTGQYSGDNTFLPVSGLQSLGIDTTFDIEQVYQLGQLDVYQNVENIPNVEVTLEKVMDGTALIQHLATPLTGFGASLINRYSNQRCDVIANFYRDVLANATGGLLVHSCVMSGMYVSSINFNLPIDGNFTESVTLVGNSKNWVVPAPSSFRPSFGVHTSPSTGFVSRRQHIIFGAGASASDTNVSYLPKEIPGIDSTGFNKTSWGGLTWDGFGAHVQSIQISADLGRTELFELGKRGPYHRYLDFPIEVTCAIEVVDTQGDSVIAQEEATNNVTDQKIYLVIQDGTIIDLGTKNRLTSISSTAGDTGGGNRTVTYNYTNFNNLTVTRQDAVGPGVSFTAPASSKDPAQAEDEVPFLSEDKL